MVQVLWGRGIKSDLPLCTVSMKSATHPRLYFEYLERLLLRHHMCMCVNTARPARSRLLLSQTATYLVVGQSADAPHYIGRLWVVATVEIFPLSAHSVYIRLPAVINKQSNRGRCTSLYITAIRGYYSNCVYHRLIQTHRIFVLLLLIFIIRSRVGLFRYGAR